MEDKCLSKFVIASIYIMAAILMFIITDSVYTSNASAQTDETNRAINIQRTTSSGENVTDNDDDVGNALIMPSTIINNFGSVAIDKFANIFIAYSRIVPF